jgi:NtrC-family two-component system response regulator AlgB
MPPIRERVADLPEMIHYYLTHFCQRYDRETMTFSPEAMNILLRYAWPGNLREMSNVIERCVILAEDSPMDVDLLPATLSGSKPELPMPGQPISLEALTGLHIQKVLEQSDSMEQAASILGIDTATLYRKRKKMGLV